jgi:hypothetical protein
VPEDYDQRRVNVGAELLDYRPIRLDTIVDLLERSTLGTHLRHRVDAEDVLTRATDEAE